MTSLIEEYLNYQKKFQNKYGLNTIVFMEVGSFYELYEVNGTGKATEVSLLLNILLTRKNKSIKQVSLKNPLMAGIPSISLSKHLSVLSSLNKYTIVLVEQTTPPPNVIRQVTEIISPGTALSPRDAHNNFLFSCFFEKFNSKHIGLGLSIIDVSTGQTMVYQSLSSLDEASKPLQDLTRFIVKFQPNEMTITFMDFDDTDIDILLDILPDLPAFTTTEYTSSRFKVEFINDIFDELYHNDTMLSGIEFLGLEHLQLGSNSLIGLIDFLKDHNPILLKQLSKPDLITEEDDLILTNNSLFQLDVINPRTQKENMGSLFSFYDRTVTAIGSRLLKSRLTNPTSVSSELNRRYELVDFFIKNDLFVTVRERLTGTLDLERLFRKIAIGTSSPNDILSVYNSMVKIRQIQPLLHSNGVIFSEDMVFNIDSIINFIESVFIIDSLESFVVNNIGINIYKPTVSIEIDNQYQRLSVLNTELTEYCDDFNQQHGTKATIDSTDKDGHFISITNSQLKNSKIDSSLFALRKHTTKSKLFNAELSLLSDGIMLVSKKILTLTDFVFSHQIDKFYSNFRHLVENIISDTAQLDVACNTAYIAIKNNYFKPTIVQEDSAYLNCKNLRHPIAEHLAKTDFVQNNILLYPDALGKLIFGVNATGKSTLLKATGLAVIMAQSGLYVAAEMIFSPFKSLFTRITTGDNIFKNQSTFTVEMLELKAILSQSTADSLILADELSHGTETNSGVAILSTSIDFLTKVGAKFIFTTHLHQVTNVSIIKNNKLVNLEHLSVDFNDNDKCFIYNRKLEPGSGDSVYGLIVAKGLGLDKEFIRSANSILLEITSDKNNIQHLLDFNQTKYNANKLKANCELCGENAIDTHHIEHQSKANPRNFTENGHLNRKSNLLSVCKGCHSDIHNGTIKNIRYIFTTYGIMLQYSKEDNK